jgi:hypothetical protein
MSKEISDHLPAWRSHRTRARHLTFGRSAIWTSLCSHQAQPRQASAGDESGGFYLTSAFTRHRRTREKRAPKRGEVTLRVIHASITNELG